MEMQDQSALKMDANKTRQTEDVRKQHSSTAPCEMKFMTITDDGLESVGQRGKGADLLTFIPLGFIKVVLGWRILHCYFTEPFKNFTPFWFFTNLSCS